MGTIYFSGDGTPVKKHKSHPPEGGRFLVFNWIKREGGGGASWIDWSVWLSIWLWWQHNGTNSHWLLFWSRCNNRISEKQKAETGGRTTNKVCRTIDGVFIFAVRAEEEWNRGFHRKPKKSRRESRICKKVGVKVGPGGGVVEVSFDGYLVNTNKWGGSWVIFTHGLGWLRCCLMCAGLFIMLVSNVE